MSFTYQGDLQKEMKIQRNGPEYFTLGLMKVVMTVVEECGGFRSTKHVLGILLAECQRACLLICFSPVLCDLCDPTDVASQAPLSLGFSRQEYWSGLPCPSPVDLPNSGIEPASHMSHIRIYISSFNLQYHLMS